MSEELQRAKDRAPVKVDDKPKRFVEKGPHVIYDSQTKIFWMKKDSWQDKGKFFNWHESRDYSDLKNMRQIGGFNDWRLPSTDEAKTLFDVSMENPGKGGVTLHIDPIFPEGAFKVEWLGGDTSTRRPRFNYVEGKEIAVDEYSFGSVRLCRKDIIRKDSPAPPRRR